MGLFNKKDSLQKKPALLFDTEEQDFVRQEAGYNEVVDYLVGLSDEDYIKVCKVAEIYRKANAEALEALGIENQPTTFIQQPEPEEPEQSEDELADNFLDDELDNAFLEDIDPTKDGKRPAKPADKK